MNRHSITPTLRRVLSALALAGAAAPALRA